MGTKNNPGNINCYAAALPDEHVFVLLGRDPAMPATIRFWMGERARLGKNVDTDDLQKLGEAGQVADAAEGWRDKLVKWADEAEIAYPWKHSRIGDTDPPIRTDADTWGGAAGGPVRVQEIPGWGEWVTAGSLAIARYTDDGFLPMKALAELIAGTERGGWHYEGAIPHPNGNPHYLFRRLDYVFGMQSDRQPLRVDHTTNLSEAVQDNLHLRAKAVVGLNQIVNDLGNFVRAKVEDPENHGTASMLLGFGDRINGFAAELGDGLPVDMIGLPQLDPARGADTSHATVAVVPDDVLDLGGFEADAGHMASEAVLPVVEDPEDPDNPDQRPAVERLIDEDCGCGTLERCRERAWELHRAISTDGMEAVKAALQWGNPVYAVIGQTDKIPLLCAWITAAEAEIGKTDLGRGLQA